MATMNAVPFMDEGKTGILHPPKQSAPGTRKKPRSVRVPTTSSVSIPSRYRTIVISTTETKGFNSQSPRFADHNINYNPGPGTYSTAHTPMETSSVSFSKRGIGGCATKNQRFTRIRQQNLGPGSYNPQPVENRRDFSHAGSSSYFQNPIAVNVVDRKKQTPAPNAYNPSGLHTAGKNTLVTAEAAFKSKTDRGRIRPDLIANPGPCQYQVADTLLHPTSCSYKSVFKSKSSRAWNSLNKRRGPGPADYDTYTGIGDAALPSPRITSRAFHNYKGKNALLISAPALPHYTIPPPPGPGHYDMQNTMAIFDEKNRQAASGAVFKSVTGRWMSSADISKSRGKPGPTSYNPWPEERKSYLYNIQHRWI